MSEITIESIKCETISLAKSIECIGDIKFLSELLRINASILKAQERVAQIQ